jgi:hypothetical protein
MQSRRDRRFDDDFTLLQSKSIGPTHSTLREEFDPVTLPGELCWTLEM